MKLTKILATALVSLFAMSAAVSAADPACVLDFTNEANLANFQNGGSGNNVTVTYDAAESAFVFAPSGGDPYITYNLPADQQFDCAANTWCKINYKTSGDVGGIQSQFFWNTSTVSGPSGGNEVNWYRDAEDGEWYEQVVEMLPTNEGGWDGIINVLRFDAFQDEDSWGDEELFVKYVAFFASEADANAYTFAPAAAAPEADPEPEAPATSETTPAPEAGAAQTADMASVAAIALVAAAAVVVASKKR